MKKFIFTVLLVFISYASFAQWDISLKNGDELLNIPAHYFHVYYDDINGAGYIAFRSNDDTFMVSAAKGIFDYNQNDLCKVIIGFYENDKLTNKIETNFTVGNNSKTAGTFGEIGREIIMHLKNKGDVRIILPKRYDNNIDIRIPMNKNIHFNIQK